jgi:hypothetical protein
MTKTHGWELPFLFGVAALDVVAVGCWFLRARPRTTVLACSLLLLGLACWYAKVRRADQELARRTARSLVRAMVILVLVVPFLLRTLLAAP